MGTRGRVAGAAAGCAVAIATLLGTPSVTAQEVCALCAPGEEQPGDGFHKEAAFLKVEGAFLKVNETLFHKLAAPEDQFHKIGAPIGDDQGGIVYPGNTGDIFYKE